jgi:hypothetical protein
MNEIIWNRKVYTILDFMGDVGGLFDALNYLGFGFTWFVAARSANMIFLSQLFTISRKPERNG